MAFMVNNFLQKAIGHSTGFEGSTASAMPPKVSVFGIQLSETIIVEWGIILILIILAALFRIFVYKKFKTVPKGIQNVLEIIVDGAEKLTGSKLEERGKAVAPYIFAIGTIIISSGLIEMLGFRPPTTDINFTAAIALMSFLVINIFGFYYTGFFGRIKWFFKPNPIMILVNPVTHVIIPVSLAARLFGNMFAGLVVMDLLYSAGALAYVVPAFVSIYFNLFHVGIQTYIFLVLTLTFTEETITYGTKR